MALLWIDGFEGYGGTDGIASSLLAARGYGNTGGSYYIGIGNKIGYCLYFNVGQSNVLITPALTTDSTFIFGCAVYFGSSNYINLGMYDDGTYGMNVTFQPGTPATVTVRLGNSTIASDSSFSTMPKWHYIEMKVFCHASSGSVEVRIDNKTIISITGINTKAGAHDYHNKLNFNAATNTYVDDFYVCDGSGSTCNDFQGICKVVGLLPSGDTDTVQWTPSAESTHYSLVDDNPANGDTDYVYTSTQTLMDLYDYPHLIGTGTIKGLQLNTQARLSAGTSIILQTPIISNGTTEIGPDTTLTSASYADYRHISTTDPYTSSAWTIDGLNAAQIGIKAI
jgi:hypothetical protein